MDVVIYARYSSHNQTECSIDGQLKECRQYAERNNYNIIGEYIDRAKSGTKDDREQFLLMLEDAKKGLFQGVLVYQLDRFARNRYDSAIHKKQLKDRGIRVLSARENITDDASGILLESLLEGIAEYYSVELSQKVKRGMKINAENCYYNGGTVPLGFTLKEFKITTNGKPMIKKKYVIDEETAPVVKKIFEMYANRESLASITRYLNELGYKTVNNQEFNKSSLGRILNNKKYIGIYSYRGIETPGAIPRIIEDDLFERVQQELKKNGMAPARVRAKTEYLLTTKLMCGCCKEYMTGYSGTSKIGKLHTYYKCKNKDCPTKAIQKDYIEDLVANATQTFLTNENIDYVAKEIVDIINDNQDDTDLKKMRSNYKSLEKKKKNILTAIYECEVESIRKTFYEDLSNIEDAIKQLSISITREENKFINITASEIKFFLKKLRKGNIANFYYKKTLINTLVNKVLLYEDKMVIIFNVNNAEQEITISLIKNLESSDFKVSALPFENKTT